MTVGTFFERPDQQKARRRRRAFLLVIQWRLAPRLYWFMMSWPVRAAVSGAETRRTNLAMSTAGWRDA